MVVVKTPPDQHFPVITALLVVAAVAIYLFADAARLFVYDRSAILAGESWRIVTGHLVHFSRSHLLLDLAVFASAGSWLEYRARRRYAGLLLVTALVNGVYFLLALPDMTRYGGLSGLASANVVYLALIELRRDRPTRPFWLALLGVFVVKSLYETVTGQAAFVAANGIPFEAVPAAHIVSGLVALLWFYGLRGLHQTGPHAR